MDNMGDEEKKRKYDRCVMVCAGDIELSEIPVREGDLLIAVDGGYAYCRVFGLTPDRVVGDFDSLTKTDAASVAALEKEASQKVLRLPVEKDDTDTLAALKWALAEGVREFHLYGALGGRLAHTLANIQCLLYLKHHGAAGYIWDGGSMLTVIENESLVFRKEMTGMLSIFSLGEKAEGVMEKGLKYQLNNGEVTNDFPVGISNEFIGEQAEVSVKRGALLVMVCWEMQDEME